MLMLYHGRGSHPILWALKAKSTEKTLEAASYKSPSSPVTQFCSNPFLRLCSEGKASSVLGCFQAPWETCSPKGPGSWAGHGGSSALGQGGEGSTPRSQPEQQ